MNRTTKIVATFTLAAALALTIACGGENDDNAATSTPQTTPQRAAGSTTTPTGSATVTPDETPAGPAATPTIAVFDPAPRPASPTTNPAPPPPPPPAATATTAPPPPPPPPPAATTITIAASGVRFSTASLAAPANSAITVVFNNNAQALPHNIVFYNGTSSSSSRLAGTEIETGPVTQTLTLGPLSAGSYYYACTAHPQTMTGTLTVS